MKLYKILDGVSFVCGMLGFGGIAGAIENGTGYITSVTLLIICLLCALWSAFENGNLKRRR